jgi:hypothetical protein
MIFVGRCPIARDFNLIPSVASYIDPKRTSGRTAVDIRITAVLHSSFFIVIGVTRAAICVRIRVSSELTAIHRQP